MLLPVGGNVCLSVCLSVFSFIVGQHAGLSFQWVAVEELKLISDGMGICI